MTHCNEHLQVNVRGYCRAEGRMWRDWEMCRMGGEVAMLNYQRFSKEMVLN